MLVTTGTRTQTLVMDRFGFSDQFNLLCGLISSYLNPLVFLKKNPYSLFNLENSISRHTITFAESPDAHVHNLFWRYESLLAEYTDGLYTERQFKERLREALESEHIPQSIDWIGD